MAEDKERDERTERDERLERPDPEPEEPVRPTREPVPGIEHAPEPDGENLIPKKDGPGTL